MLARIRRLTELGLTLDEVADAMGDSRARLATLIERTRVQPDEAVTPELLALLDVLSTRLQPHWRTGTRDLVRPLT